MLSGTTGVAHELSSSWFTHQRLSSGCTSTMSVVHT